MDYGIVWVDLWKLHRQISGIGDTLSGENYLARATLLQENAEL